MTNTPLNIGAAEGGRPGAFRKVSDTLLNRPKVVMKVPAVTL